MSWFKRGGGTTVGPYHRNNDGVLPSNSSAHHIRAAADSGLLLHAVHSLWNAVESVLHKLDNRPSENETAAVLSFITEVATSLECHNTTAHTQLTDFLLMVDAMNKLLSWTVRFSAIIDTESADRLALLQLRVFDLLLNHSERCLLTEKRLIWPLLRLLVACGPSKNCSIEDQLALVLHQLCVGVSQYPASLELLFDAVSADGSRSEGEGAAADSNSNKFLVFSLLVPYVHREGLIAQQARDDLLLIMSMSSSLDIIGRHIVDKSDFCPLLATGLSGLYSSLPRRIDYPSDDWNQITPEDIAACPPLGRFMNSLEFCNAVIQVAHPYVCENLKKYVYDGFLVSVLGPALHQSGIVFIRWDAIDSIEDNLTQQSVSSMDEVTAATAYLELFIRKTSEPGLLRTFVDFILSSHFDEVSIVDSLISRVFSVPRLCMATLTLFKTLVDLNFEDVMYHLIFKYLVPCTHVMVSQQKSFRDSDTYCKVAEKLISLMPLSCHVKVSGLSLLNESDESQSDGSASSLVGFETMTTGVQSPRVTSTVLSSFQRTGAGKLFSSFRRKPRQSPTRDDTSLNGSITGSGDGVRDSTPPSTPIHSSQVQLESNYMEYLLGARTMIHECIRETAKWTAPYNGENPPPASRSFQSSEKNTPVKDSFASGLLVSSEDAIGTGSDVRADYSNHQVTDIDAFESVVPPILTNKVVPRKNSSTVLEMHDFVTTPSLELNDAGVNLRLDLAVDSSDSEIVKNIGINYNSDRANEPFAVQAGIIMPTIVKATGELFTTGNEAELESLVDSVPSGKSVDSLELFIRQLSHVSAKLDDTSVEDDFTEFDALIEHLTEHVSQSTTVDLQPSSLICANGESCVIGSVDSKQSSNELTSEFEATDRLLGNIETLAQNTSGELSAVVRDNEKDSSSKKTAVKSGDVDFDGEVPLSYSLSSLQVPSPTYDASPTIGPFLTSLLGKLELMVQNPLYVNLQLTGLLARLACFPQPLLKSLLLSHTLVFQPSIKSLLQVLTTVKHRLDNYILTVPDYDALLVQASQYLKWRDEVSRQDGDATQFTPGRHPIAILQGERRKSSTSLSDFWRRASLRGTEQLQPLTLDQRGAHFVNRQGSPLGDAQVSEPLEVRTKNAIYCAIVLKEFVKELAAISQEHVLMQAYCGNT